MAIGSGKADAVSGTESPRPGELNPRTLARCRAKDPVAFRAFVVRYERPVFALVSRLLGRGPHVQDVAQEAFVRAYEAFPRFDPEGPARPSTWLLTIATRVALDWARRERPEREALSHVEAAAAVPSADPRPPGASWGGRSSAPPSSSPTSSARSSCSQTSRR